jgi:hypothetical protein
MDLVHSENGLQFFKLSIRPLGILRAWSNFWNGGVELLINLSSSDTLETSEPRDIVYSLLGITKPYRKSELTVDYTISISELLRRTAKHIILGSKSLDIFLCRPKGEEFSPNSPSWVSDWTHYKRSRHSESAAPSGSWSAGGSSYRSIDFLENATLLKTKSSIIGIIHGFVAGRDVRLVHGEELECEAELAALLIEWVRFAISGLYLSHENVVFGDEELRIGLNGLYILYQVIILSCVGTEQVEREWPFIDFISWLVSATSQFPGPSLRHLTWAQLALFTNGLSPDRCLLTCDLPQSLQRMGCSRTLGTCSTDAQLGDTIAVIYGCQSPLIIRQIEGTGEYKIVGDACVDGLMGGEAIGVLPQTDIRMR